MAFVRFRPTRRHPQQCRQVNLDGGFDFDRLPDYLFIRILEQLEPRQRFNIARVNHRFKAMSDLSVTMIDSFDFNVDINGLYKFREVVGKFARNLRVASMCWDPEATERFGAILDFKFPRLADIEIKCWTNRVVNFLARCPDLRRLKISGYYANETVDLGRSVFPHVERIDFDYCPSTMIERLLDACPNVNHFSMEQIQGETWQLVRKLDQYFADRVSSMESISMHICRVPWNPPFDPTLRVGFEHLWRLRSLRVLKIALKYYSITVGDTMTISNSFPNLEVLHLATGSFRNGSISALSKLENLVDLELHEREIFIGDSDISEFVMTSEASGLRRFEINGRFSLRMVKNIIERFPHLKNLIVRRLSREGSMCSAISNFAKDLRRQFARRDLKIVLFVKQQWLPESKRIRRAIEKIRRAAGDDERRPGLELDVRRLYMVRIPLVPPSNIRRFWKRIEKRIVGIYHRIFDM